MSPININVDKENAQLVLSWNDGTKSTIKLANIRKLCPCAICSAQKEERSDSYIPIYTKEELTITNIDLVGQYAISITWEDGHNSGIHEFNHLKKMDS